MSEAIGAERPTQRQDGCRALGREIEAAWALAEAGQRRAAAALCAAVCLHDLQSLRGAPALKGRLVEALLLTGMFGQLARLVRALDGVEVSVACMAGNGTADAFLCGEDGHRLVVAFDPRSLEGPDRARVAKAWGRRILDEAGLRSS